MWIFNGTNSRFCSGAFSSRDIAEEWIRKNKLTGMLTLYAIDISTYDWAIENNFFSPLKDNERTPEFIQRFTSASQEHYHYSDGEIE